MPAKKSPAKPVTKSKPAPKPVPAAVFRCRLGGEHPTPIEAERCPADPVIRCATAGLLYGGR